MSSPLKISKKIGFYSLHVFKKANRDENLQPQKYIQNILDFITKLEKPDRRRDLENDRFYFLSDCNNSEGDPEIQEVVFKFAESGKLPPLIDKSTLSERPNTKNITEGDRDRTHVVVRYFDDEAIVLLEETRPGITIKRLVYYLRFFAGEFHHKTKTKFNYDIGYRFIPKGNFIDELRKLKRINVGTITMSKRLIGSEGLNLSDRISEVQRQINVELKAQRNKDIRGLIEELVEKMSAPESEVERLRIEAFNQQNQPVKLDTEAIKKERILEFIPDPLTKEVKTEEILNRLAQIIREL